MGKNTNKDSGVKFTKDALLKSKIFMNQRDLVDALLENDRTYTVQEVNRLIVKYLKEEVK